MEPMGVYFPTTNGSLYQVNAYWRDRKHSDKQVSAVMTRKVSRLVEPLSAFKAQEEVLSIAAEAAYNGFSQLDKHNGFSGRVDVALSFGVSAHFKTNSTSSGLSYALALFHAWYEVVLSERAIPLPHWPIVVATGQVSKSGDIFPVAGVSDKVQGLVDWLSTLNNTPDVLFVCHPENLSDEVRATLDAHNIDYCAQTQLPKVLKYLCGDSYHEEDVETNPFKGLDSFDEVDALRFFGRDKERDAIIEKLEDTTQPLIVSGSSGSGKSSLLKAGVIPKLRQTNEGIIIDIITPDKIGKDISAWLTHKAFHRTDFQQLLIIDQTEQLFRWDQDLVNQWINALIDWHTKSPILSLIISLRSEFKHQLEQHPAFCSTNDYNLPPRLQPSQWDEILDKQVRYANLEIETALLDRLKRDAQDVDDNLPLISLLLRQIYEKADKHRLKVTIADYEAAGQLEGVIDQLAEEAVSSFSQDTLETYLPLVFQRLVYYKVGEHATILSQPFRLGNNFPKIAEQLVNQLYKHRILQRLDVHTYSFSHEQIIASWSRLNKWLKSHKEIFIWLQKTKNQANEWKNKGTPKSLLLKKGLELAEAKRNLRSISRLSEFSDYDYLIEFIKASDRQAITQNVFYFMGGITVMSFITIALYVFLISQRASIDSQRVLKDNAEFLTNEVFPVLGNDLPDTLLLELAERLKSINNQKEDSKNKINQLARQAIFNDLQQSALTSLTIADQFMLANKLDEATVNYKNAINLIPKQEKNKFDTLINYSLSISALSGLSRAQVMSGKNDESLVTQSNLAAQLKRAIDEFPDSEQIFNVFLNSAFYNSAMKAQVLKYKDLKGYLLKFYKKYSELYASDPDNDKNRWNYALAASALVRMNLNRNNSLEAKKYYSKAFQVLSYWEHDFFIGNRTLLPIYTQINLDFCSLFALSGKYQDATAILNSYIESIYFSASQTTNNSTLMMQYIISINHLGAITEHFLATNRSMSHSQSDLSYLEEKIKQNVVKHTEKGFELLFQSHSSGEFLLNAISEFYKVADIDLSSPSIQEIIIKTHKKVKSLEVKFGNQKAYSWVSAIGNNLNAIINLKRFEYYEQDRNYLLLAKNYFQYSIDWAEKLTMQVGKQPSIVDLIAANYAGLMKVSEYENDAKSYFKYSDLNIRQAEYLLQLNQSEFVQNFIKSKLFDINTQTASYARKHVPDSCRVGKYLEEAKVYFKYLKNYGQKSLNPESIVIFEELSKLNLQNCNE